MSDTYPIKIEFKRTLAPNYKGYSVEITTPITFMAKLPAVIDNEEFPLALLRVGIEMTLDEIRKLHHRLSEIISLEERHSKGESVPYEKFFGAS